MQRTCYWVFTLNNPIENVLPTLLLNRLQYAIWQLESGDSGTPHLQGYLETSKRVTLGVLRGLVPRAHWEPRRGTRAQAIAYSSKEDTRLDGPWTYGSEPPEPQPGKRTDLDLLATRLYEGESLDNLRSQFPGHTLRYRRCILDQLAERSRIRWGSTYRRGLSVYVLWGDSGTGKTRSVYERFGLDEVFTLNTASSGALWFDGYEEHPVLLIDDFRGWIKFNEVLKICDIYPYRCAVKGAHIWAAWTTVVFTSNHDPTTWWKEESGHFFPAFLRRIHKTIHFSSDHPWCSDVDVFDVEHPSEGPVSVADADPTEDHSGDAAE